MDINLNSFIKTQYKNSNPVQVFNLGETIKNKDTIKH